VEADLSATPDLWQRIQESAAALAARGFPRPSVGMVLGTGLGRLGEAIRLTAEARFEEIPHFARSTVESHAGRLLAGELAGVPVLAMQGRLHMYEGYSLPQVTFPVRVMRALGAEVLILSNAAGGLNPLFATGDLMLVDDHLNLMGDNPLRGPNDDRLGPRFPDMSEPYDRRLLALTEATALEARLPVRRGVLAALCGPALETRAEYRFLRQAGADAVTMSSVPEAIVGVHGGMRVLGISVITDMCLPDALQPLDIAKVIRVANEAEPRLSRLVELILSDFEPAPALEKRGRASPRRREP
jgi:purine-nucleoside phosphorylase